LGNGGKIEPYTILIMGCTVLVLTLADLRLGVVTLVTSLTHARTVFGKMTHCAAVVVGHGPHHAEGLVNPKVRAKKIGY
jgi:hypothetical protein